MGSRSSGGGGLALGVAMGVALGAAMDNIGVGIALGVALGAALAGAQRRKSNPSVGDDDESGEKPRA